jgi:ornithine cyclodeaminase/alanine dehydrogenase-like protein (mu-crystallin family)
VLVLTRQEIEGLLTPGDVIEALAAAFRRHAAGRTAVPPRTVVQSAEDGLLLLMPAASLPATGQADGALGTKLVTFYANNRARGYPTHLAIYALMDQATGALLALLDAEFTTGLRTGATSALAARHLARPDSHRAVCFGSSVQAAFQLRGLTAVLPLRHVTVIGRDSGRARAFAARMQAELGVEMAVGPAAPEALRDADVVTCATTATTPLFDGADLAPGAHVDAIGSFRPATRELDTATIRRARVVVETYDGVLAEAGDLLIPIQEGAIAREHIVAELAELVSGARPGRLSADDITVFKSVGFALEDLATARLAYERARERGVGTEVSLGGVPTHSPG